ncbi:MAG: AraC family ligand binding domain-containing protein [Ignavibacteriaceae bacterium]|nr:AraC family ligand binding domain-containing protein [Ignavibacteriaceae bacterium]
MSRFIDCPSIIKAEGNKPKIIEEYVGRVNTQTEDISIARMKSPEGWIEPGQTPEFEEFTLVVRGKLNVKTNEANYSLKEGQAVLIRGGEWVQYSSPGPGGAEYISVCLPAFSPVTVHRDIIK